MDATKCLEDFFRKHRKGRLFFRLAVEGMPFEGSSPVSSFRVQVLAGEKRVEFREHPEAQEPGAVLSFSLDALDGAETIPGEVRLFFPTGKITLEPFFDQEEDTALCALIASFQEEFGGLTSNEYDQLRVWLTEWAPEIVAEALRLAALAGKRQFRYIDRILLNWSKAKVRTLDDIRAREEEFQRGKGAAQQGSVPGPRSRGGRNRPPASSLNRGDDWGSLTEEYLRRKDGGPRGRLGGDRAPSAGEADGGSS